MSCVSRREALAWISAAGAACVRAGRPASGQAATAPPGGPNSADPSAPPSETPYAFSLPRAGTLRAPRSAAIERSAISVGFETLDRRHFDPARTYRWLGESGAKWARCQTGWNRCETVAGEYAFAWLDEVVDRLLEIGIQPWFNLGYGNKLYTPEATDAAAVGWAPVFTGAAREAWVRFVRAIAARFADRVKHWEIWNEPNHSGFWRPRSPSARDYVELVRLSAPEIRRLVPGAVIIGGALAGMPKSYLAECIDSWAKPSPKLFEYYGGESLLSRSHGQRHLQYFRSTYQRKGLYFLDEPENALSPKNQIELLKIIEETAAGGSAQFLIVSHSPILLACPRATLYQFDTVPISSTRYEDTDYYRIYKDFLNHRDSY
mgnify:CR=1 FL=1